MFGAKWPSAYTIGLAWSVQCAAMTDARSLCQQRFFLLSSRSTRLQTEKNTQMHYWLSSKPQNVTVDSFWQEAVFKFHYNGVEYSRLKQNLYDVCSTKTINLGRQVNALFCVFTHSSILLWQLNRSVTRINSAKIFESTSWCLLHHRCHFVGNTLLHAGESRFTTTIHAVWCRIIRLASVSTKRLQWCTNELQVALVICCFLQAPYTASPTLATTII